MRWFVGWIEDIIDRIYNISYWLDGFKVRLAKRLWTGSRRRRFYEKLSELMENGAKLTDALSSLQRRVRRRSRGFSPHYYALGSIRSAIREGNMLSEALEGWAPEHEINIIRSGEEAGDLPQTLSFTTRILDGRKRLLQAFVSALAYPLLLILGTCGLIFFIGYSLIPRMAAIGEPGTWQGSAFVLYQLSLFLQTYWALSIPVAALVLMTLIGLSFNSSILPKRMRVFLDAYPPWSFYRLFVGCGFLLNLSSLLNAGVSQQDALRLIRDHAQNYLRVRINAILREMRAGADNIGEAMHGAGYEFPDPEIIEDLMTYSDLPNFTEKLQAMGIEWMDKGVERVETEAQYLNWALLFGMGSLIAWTAWAVYSIQQTLMSSLML